MNHDIYYILCECLSPEGIKTVKQLHVFNALEANTIAAEYISNGWHVTIDVEKTYNKNTPVADVISLFDKARQRKQMKGAALLLSSAKGAKEILQDAAARNAANKKRLEAERHRNDQNVLKAYDMLKPGGKKK